MLRPALFSLVLSVLAHAFVVEVPLQSGNPSILADEERAEWRLDALPDPDATDHLVFDTVHSLLQHWPNTRMRNGHNLVPGVIPEGTLLYHGTHTQHLPQGPEWYAFNVEHSHFFCRESVLALSEGCWLFTFATTRPLKVVYFDGNSAAKLPWGSLDTQDYLAWGETRPQDMWLEFARANALCEWAAKFGVDGFIRMEMSFEFLACNFADGVAVLSSANVARPMTLKPVWCESLSDYLLAKDRTTLSAARPVLEIAIAGSSQDRFPGETRVQLDLAGLVSFYDTELAPSLVPIRANQERWDHRVQNVSREDLSAAMARLEMAVTRPAGQSSGTDWTTLINVLVDRYATRLGVTRHLLNSPVPTTERLLDLANKVQTQLRIMLTPYLLLSATPIDGVDVDWSVPVYRLCATTHTRGLVSLQHAMTDSERLLLRAVRGTSREICRVVTRMWVAGVHVGVDPSLSTGTPDVAALERVWHARGQDINRLADWLDWSVWVKCEPECDPEALCYLPTWPLDFPHFPRPDEGDRRWWEADMPDSNAWVRPQPTCVSRTQDLPW